MTCDPNTLSESAKCFCFSQAQARQVWIYLLCQWSGGSGPVVECVNLEGEGSPVTASVPTNGPTDCENLEGAGAPT